VTHELELLQLYGQLHQQHVEIEQLTHQFASYDDEGQFKVFGTGEVLQALHAMGFQAHLKRGSRKNFQTNTWPVLMPVRDGGLMLVGNMYTTDGGESVVVVQRSGQSKPTQLSLKEFDELFIGEWIDAMPES